MFNINGFRHDASRPTRVSVVVSDDPNRAIHEIDALADTGEYSRLSAWSIGRTVSDGIADIHWSRETIGGHECDILRTPHWGGVVYVDTERYGGARRCDITRYLRRMYGENVHVFADNSSSGELSGETVTYAYRAPALAALAGF